MTSQRNIDPRESQDSSDVQRVNSYPKGNLFKRLFRIELRAEAVVNLDDVVGEIDPRIYGHFISAPKFYGWDGHEQDAEVADRLRFSGNRPGTEVADITGASSPASSLVAGSKVARSWELPMKREWMSAIGLSIPGT